MPDIGDMKYGTSGGGVQEYLESIKSTVLTEIGEDLIDGLTAIDEACDQHWEGDAKKKFKKNIKSDAEHVKQQYERLYNILRNEIISASSAMVQKDKNMFD